ncbi:hypothetical protein [Catalinimonas niigatensis]|uniref:hypothetical protein n=1 Tax=Catalinimonas niigatensis TaxID=1397264 RepID=UPI0026666C94|nr:hypothetical protein [Catalinimonas niigatensis]WPP53063.1 hypothetical protein PZB72_11815 [Catalinimonas niigatensis]
MATKKSRNLILLLSVILAILAVLMQFSVIIIPGLMPYKFWLMVIAYGLVLGAR